MGEVIDLDQEREDRGLWVTGKAQCSLCRYTWIATCPVTYTGQGLDCPRGHQQSGLWPLPPEGER